MKKLRRLFFCVIALAVISVVNSWATCTTTTKTDNFNCTGASWFSCRVNDPYDGQIYFGCYSSDGAGQWASQSLACYTRQNCTVSVGLSGIHCAAKVITCSTPTEADSVRCEQAGNVWQGGTCKVNHCKSADSTWLSTSIAACTGSNNYALVNTDSTCEHVGTCCPNDSIPSGNTCKWRCDSVLTTCEGRVGTLFGAVLPDTSVSGQDTTFSYQCFYNCAHSPNTDSTVYLVEGNVVLSGPSDSISDGIKSETFNSFRTTSGGLYIYDYLSPAASEYVDSIAAMKCVEHLWRCVINNKYVYWYDNQEVPVGCTNIVRVK